MQRNFLTASLVLLAITALAILWHSIDLGTPRPTPLNLSSNNNLLSSEQKFLVNGPIDINTATTEDLIAIPRIGPSLAKKIIEFRTAHGPIKSLEELLEVKGIGPRIFESIKPYLRAK